MSNQFTDEQIERCGRLYRANPALHQGDFDFITFMRHEKALVDQLVFNGDAMAACDEFLPLLPEQLLIARDMEQREIITDTVARLHLDDELQQDYPETARCGDRLSAPIHRRWPSARYKTGSHKQRQRRVVGS